MIEDNKIQIIGQYLKINEAAETIKLKNPIEQKLIKQYSDELNSFINSPQLIKNFEEISKNMIAMGIKPKIVQNSFLIYRYSTIEEGLELLYKNQEGEYNHKFIVCDENLCFICREDEKCHRNLNRFLTNKSFNNRSSLIEEDENLKRIINEKENFLRKTVSKEILFLKKDSGNHSATKISINENKNPNKVNTRIDTSNQKSSSLINLDKIQFSEDNIIKVFNNECTICIFEIETDKNFNLGCNHKFCIDCIKEYLNEEIKNSRVNNISCPLKGCKNLFEENKIKELIDTETFNKYKKFLLREKYKNIPNIFWCPIVNCEGYANLTDEISKNENKNITEPLNNFESKARFF